MSFQIEGVNATHDELLAATTPEALAKLSADHEASQAGVAAQAGAQAADAAAASQPAAQGASPGANEQPSGIATKSGSGVLPYRVLQEERQEKSQWRTRATSAELERDEAQRQLQELHGRTVPPELQQLAREMTDGEIEDLEIYNPKAAKAVRLLRSSAAADAQQAPSATTQAAPAAAVPAQQAAAQPTEAQIEGRDEAIAAMQGTPLLQRLAAAGGALWDRAVGIDAALAADPNWNAKPIAERFGEVQRRMSEFLGVSPAQGAPNQVAAPATPATQHFQPNTTSDLAGGASPHADQAWGDGASGMAMAKRFMSMTPEQVATQLRKFG